MTTKPAITPKLERAIADLLAASKGAIFALDSVVMLSDLKPDAKTELIRYRHALNNSMDEATRQLNKAKGEA